jgi:hypothetical protein
MVIIPWILALVAGVLITSDTLIRGDLESPQQSTSPDAFQPAPTSLKDLELGRSRPMASHLVTSPCTDEGGFEHSSDGKGKTFYTSVCFPSYPYYYDSTKEGHFLSSTHQPLPILGRTCGDFKILVVFFNTEQNRQLWSQNLNIPFAVRDKIEQDPEEALRNLFSGYSPKKVFEHLRVEPPANFDFDFLVLNEYEDSSKLQSSPEKGKYIQKFLPYDAVLFLEDLGQFAGFGIGKWPIRHPLFNSQLPTAFKINPKSLTPGLFENELFRRNLPALLSEYILGEKTIVTNSRGIHVSQTPVYNPRTEENIRDLVNPNSPNGLSLQVYLNGWYDMDQNGIPDCQDPSLTPTPDNVDGDFMPDRLDPDLTRINRPFFWTRSKSSLK